MRESTPNPNRIHEAMFIKDIQDETNPVPAVSSHSSGERSDFSMLLLDKVADSAIPAIPKIMKPSEWSMSKAVYSEGTEGASTRVRVTGAGSISRNPVCEDH